jgi:hypothetical protein
MDWGLPQALGFYMVLAPTIETALINKFRFWTCNRLLFMRSSSFPGYLLFSHFLKDRTTCCSGRRSLYHAEKLLGSALPQAGSTAGGCMDGTEPCAITLLNSPPNCVLKPAEWSPVQCWGGLVFGTGRWRPGTQARLGLLPWHPHEFTAQAGATAALRLVGSQLGCGPPHHSSLILMAAFVSFVGNLGADCAYVLRNRTKKKEIPAPCMLFCGAFVHKTKYNWTSTRSDRPLTVKAKILQHKKVSDAGIMSALMQRALIFASERLPLLSRRTSCLLSYFYKC